MVLYPFGKAELTLKFLIGLIFGLVLVPLGIYLYITSGSAPVATKDGDMPFERYLAKKALHVRIAAQMPKNAPIRADESNYLAGAQLYKDNCAVCHGLPGAPKTAIAAGMYPKPPQLFVGKGVTDDEPGETYWKILNGIRLTGMPSFSSSLNETQMWQIALLLANADKLPDSVKSALSTPAGQPPTATPAPAPKKHKQQR